MCCEHSYSVGALRPARGPAPAVERRPTIRQMTSAIEKITAM
jgi:hypothetical protein